jgi:hypothetical protein
MRLLLAAIIAAQILVLAPATAAPWVKFTDPNGQFSVMFPVAPTAKTGGTWGPGKNFPITAYMVMKGTARLVLMVVDMNLEGSNADAKAAIDSKESTLLQAMTAETVQKRGRSRNRPDFFHQKSSLSSDRYDQRNGDCTRHRRC